MNLYTTLIINELEKCQIISVYELLNILNYNYYPCSQIINVPT